MKVWMRLAAAVLAVSGASARAAEPEAFSFAERSQVATRVYISSEAKTISGTTGPWELSISGGNSPQYRIDAGAYTSAPGSIAAGQTLSVRHLSASSANTTETSTLLVGSARIAYTSITGALDRTPDDFSFGALGMVEPYALVESEAITPTGFNTALPIVVSAGAQYRINDGPYRSDNGSLQPGQSLQLRHSASGKRLEYSRSTLKLGGVVGSFTTRTQGRIESAPAPLPTLAIAAASANESASTMRFAVTLSAASSQVVSVNYASADGSATAGADYTAASGTLRFAAGETSKLIEINLNNDSLDEPSENFSLALSAPSKATLAANSATGTLEDDDDAPAPATAAACVPFDAASSTAGLSRHVDPRIGSFAPGFTNPGPVLPFGMVALGPDTEGPLNYGGYSAQNALVTGFSHVHMSAGVYKGGQIPVLPFTGELATGDAFFGGSTNPVPNYASSFERGSEIAEAGYYAVLLPRYGVLAELTATERAGLHRYTYCNPAQPPRLLLDLSRSLDGYKTAAVSLHADGTLSGRVHSDDAGGFELYFAARVNAPFTAQTLSGAALVANQERTGADLGVILNFAATTRSLLVKVALSYTDAQGAIRNLEAELPGAGFDDVRSAARAKWDQALARIEVEGGTEAEQSSFYTALYRAQHFPNLHSDVDGRYRGPDRLIHSDGRPHYSQFSSWDSYRGQNALQAELVPEIYRDMLRSLLAFHQQAGYLPRWQQGPGDASHMSGDPIIPFIGEAWCRGQIDAGLRAQLWPALHNLVTRRDAELNARGYLSVPEPSPQEAIEGGSGRAGTTLEFGIADFSLALMAQSAAAADAPAIAERSRNYRNLLDPATKWIRPRRADGQYIQNFQPELGYGFQEGTSWQYSWLAQHDYAALIAGMGGDTAVKQRLDQFFSFPASLAPLAVPAIQNQITAFGVAYYGNQYAPGNEHDLEAPYVYHYTGAPWQSAAVVRAATSIYTPTANGLPGNDDLGALSGWLVWNMIGLYPINPGSPLVLAGSPHFEKVTLHRASGDLLITAPGASAAAKFVTGLSVNGLPQANSWLILPRGPTSLNMSVSAIPDMNWASAASNRPPSLSSQGLASFGCQP